MRSKCRRSQVYARGISAASLPFLWSHLLRVVRRSDWNIDLHDVFWTTNGRSCCIWLSRVRNRDGGLGCIDADYFGTARGERFDHKSLPTTAISYIGYARIFGMKSRRQNGAITSRAVSALKRSDGVPGSVAPISRTENLGPLASNIPAFEVLTMRGAATDVKNIRKGGVVIFCSRSHPS